MATEETRFTTPEELERGERFLAAYHSIEQALRSMLGDGTRESFRHMVDELAKQNPVVRRFRDDLGEYGELRNAIVHSRVSPDYLIAVPLAETVNRIEEIARLIADPPVVYPVFKREVAVFSSDDTLDKVFKVMRERGFTQFPVYDDGVYQGLLTSAGIAWWVAEVLGRAGAESASLASVARVSVREVLSGDRNRTRARFVGKRATVYEVEEVFRENSKRDKRRVFAVLITESGRPDEKLLGIVTPSDILSLSL